MKELKIEIPEGYEIDKEKSTFEKIVFKEAEKKLPKSWFEYQELVKGKEAHNIIQRGVFIRDEKSPYHAFDTMEKSIAFVALGKLIQLRDYWIGDWEPNWKSTDVKYSIFFNGYGISTGDSVFYSRILTFPTSKMRDEFLNTFKELIKNAEIFL